MRPTAQFRHGGSVDRSITPIGAVFNCGTGGVSSYDLNVAREERWRVFQNSSFYLGSHKYVQAGGVSVFHLTAECSKGSNSYDPSFGTEAKPNSKASSNPVPGGPPPHAHTRGNYLENFSI